LQIEGAIFSERNYGFSKDLNSIITEIEFFEVYEQF
jgi:hypothetical protein